MSSHGGEANSQSRKPSDSKFKQQSLPAWQPILTPSTVIPAFFVIGIIFVPIGIALLVASQGVVESTYEYTTTCPTDCSSGYCVANLCKDISIEWKGAKTDGPVYIYYQLTNYYQNHRRYVKSRSDAQLRGDVVTKYSDLSDCAPRIANTTDQASTDDQSLFYLPCGLIAYSMFNDSFLLSQNNVAINVTNEGIAWKSDLETKFKNAPAQPHTNGFYGGANIQFTDPDFVVWMRTAGLPQFRKLWRIIPGGLDAGTYNLTLLSAFPVQSFSGTKTFVMSTTSWMGGKNDFLGLAYIIVGSICIFLGIVFLIINKIKPRRLGDPEFLVWHNN